MTGRSLVISLTFIFLGACSYPGNLSVFKDVKFSKRGITNQQLDADWLPAEKKILSPCLSQRWDKRSMSYAEEYLIDGCMAAKGYTVTW